MIGTILLAMLTASVVFLSLHGIRHFRSAPKVTRSRIQYPAPKVSIIIPMRNEERNAARVLQSLTNQTYPNYEIIVVEDGSTDSTVDIVKSFDVDLIQIDTLPPDWVGKNYACHIGQSCAAGGYLLFTDADTYHEREALESIMTYVVENEVDMLAPTIGHNNVGFWEKVVQPCVFNIHFLLYRIEKVNDPRSKYSIANGQYLLIRREVYDAVGGHERFKGAVSEDLAVAHGVKKKRYRLRVADVRHLVKVRMYHNLSEIVSGWRKNFFTGVRREARSALIAILLVFFIFIIPPILLFFGIICTISRGSISGLFIQGVIQNVFLLSWMFIVHKKCDDSAGWALLHPLGNLVYLLIMIMSTLDGLHGRGVSWKGRQYRIDGQ